MAEPSPPPEPVLDIRVRWRAGEILLALAGASTLLALLRPLFPDPPEWARAAYALLLGLGVTGSALLSSLRGHRRAESLALYAFQALLQDLRFGFGSAISMHPAWRNSSSSSNSKAMRATSPWSLALLFLFLIIVIFFSAFSLPILN